MPIEAGGAERSAPVVPSLPWRLAVFIAAAFLFHLATIRLFPLVWQDEVMFTEPAANWARDGALVSRAWFFDRETDIWAGNSPLYTVLLTPWLKLFGVNPVAVRSFGLLLATIGISAWTVAARRAGFLSSAWSAFINLALLFTVYGAGINLRSGRYDGLGILLFGLIALTLTADNSRKRTLALMALGMLIPASGMYLAIPFVAGSLAAVAVYGRKWIGSIVALGFGIGLGGVVLFAALWQVGALEHFLYSTGKLGKVGGNEFPKDPSLFLVVLAAAIGLALRGLGQDWGKRQVVVYGFAGATIALFLISGRFPNYYSWIVIAPLLLVTLIERRRQEPVLAPVFRRAILLVLVLAVAVGLPLQIAAAFVTPNRDSDRVNRFVGQQIHADDVALVSPMAWYAVWPIAAKAYTTEYDVENKFMTPEDEGRVSVLIIDPVVFPAANARFGGDWHQVAVLPHSDKRMPIFSRNFGAKLTDQYSLVVYRHAPRDRDVAGDNPPPMR